MPKPKYALDALEQLRDAKVDEAKKVLADSVRAREAATARRQAAELALETRTHEIAHIRERERVKLEMGGADAHDLALASAWEIGARSELEQLAAAVTQRKSEETAAQQKEAEARAAVAMKRADAEVVHKDHERFDAGVRKAELAKEEEAAEEAWRRRS